MPSLESLGAMGVSALGNAIFPGLGSVAAAIGGSLLGGGAPRSGPTGTVGRVQASQFIQAIAARVAAGQTTWAAELAIQQNRCATASNPASCNMLLQEMIQAAQGQAVPVFDVPMKAPQGWMPPPLAGGGVLSFSSPVADAAIGANFVAGPQAEVGSAGVGDMSSPFDAPSSVFMGSPIVQGQPLSNQASNASMGGVLTGAEIGYVLGGTVGAPNIGALLGGAAGAYLSADSPNAHDNPLALPTGWQGPTLPGQVVQYDPSGGGGTITMTNPATGRPMVGNAAAIGPGGLLNACNALEALENQRHGLAAQEKTLRESIRHAIRIARANGIALPWSIGRCASVSRRHRRPCVRRRRRVSRGVSYSRPRRRTCARKRSCSPRRRRRSHRAGTVSFTTKDGRRVHFRTRR